MTHFYDHLMCVLYNAATGYVWPFRSFCLVLLLGTDATGEAYLPLFLPMVRLFMVIFLGPAGMILYLVLHLVTFCHFSIFHSILS